MGFFDFNIPYLESEKNTRLKTVVQALELGYTGVAYNRSIKGVISDKDICTIPQFPLSSLLKLSPNLSSSVKLHRQLLRVPVDSPFRQYTRLTVTVDSLGQCRALNSSNLVLKSYDIVAVRPVNQAAFEHCCESAEFQIKFSSVEAAVKRGVYFEITYSPLVSDVNTRKQMVLATKGNSDLCTGYLLELSHFIVGVCRIGLFLERHVLLVQWTRGRNLIISSAAASLSEIRGPCDVANLSFILGISTECAKAAISKNCRSLLRNAVKKKQYCKNAIDLKTIASTKSLESEGAWFYGGDVRGHISSSEGDSLLDDIAKSFAASSKVHKTSKAIDSALIVTEILSSGKQVEDQLHGSGGKVHLPLNLSAANVFGDFSDMDHVIRHSNKQGVDSIAGGTLLDCNPKNKTSGGQDIPTSVPGNNIPAVLMNENGTLATCFGKDNNSNSAVEMMSLCEASEGCGLECAFPTPTKDLQASECHGEGKGSPDLYMVSSSLIDVPTTGNILKDAMDICQPSTVSTEMDPSTFCNVDGTRLDGLDIMVHAPDLRMMGVLSASESKKKNLMLVGCDLSIHKDDASFEKHGQYKDQGVVHTDDKMLMDSFSKMQGDANSQPEFMLPDSISVQPYDRKKLKSGKFRSMHRISPRAFPFYRRRLSHWIIFRKTCCSHSKRRKPNIVGNRSDPKMKK